MKKGVSRLNRQPVSNDEKKNKNGDTRKSSPLLFTADSSEIKRLEELINENAEGDVLSPTLFFTEIFNRKGLNEKFKGVI